MEKLIDQLNWHNLISKLKLILRELSKSAGSEVTVETISDASVIGKSVLKGENAQAVRTLIGAGTSNLTIGSTATTAKLGNYTPSATEIVTAINAMTPEQVTAVQTKLGITPTP